MEKSINKKKSQAGASAARTPTKAPPNPPYKPLYPIQSPPPDKKHGFVLKILLIINNFEKRRMYKMMKRIPLR